MFADVLSVLLAERLQVLLMSDEVCPRCGANIGMFTIRHRCRRKKSKVIPPGQQLNLEGCTCKVKTLDGRQYVYCRCE